MKSRDPAAILRAMETLLPGPRETLLLRAALRPGPDARRAWERFTDGGGDVVRLIETDRPALRRLAPYLAARLPAAGCRLPPRTATYLRTAYVQERLRRRHYDWIVRRALEVLDAAGVEALVLKGAAFGRWLYGDPVLRHSHDLELLVTQADLDRAAAALNGEGLRRDTARAAPPWEVRLLHEHGLPVHLRSRLFRQRGLRAWEERIHERARIAEVAGGVARTPALEDHLLHVLGQAAFHRTRGSLLWACDAVLLLREASAPDWAWLEEAVARSRALLPALAMLRYLATELAAPVPVASLARLDARARAADALERDLALYAARSAAGGLPALLRAGRSWRHRAAILRRVAFPSEPYLRHAGWAASSWPPTAARLARPLRAVVRRGLRRVRAGSGTAPPSGRRSGPATRPVARRELERDGPSCAS